MDVIRLLPDAVANQIAAGEVIQRPASCLKELVENALDAGATNVQVLVRDAGKTLLQVVDNGKGMSETDARMAFERHATSKIREASDLFTLTTMGFRGEALPSICAVAQVELTTRRPEDEVGTRLEIDGSEVMFQEPAMCPVGSCFKVKNLFFNVPARRRFLKTNATELRNILTEFQRIVLVNPQCQFTLVSDDEILFDLPIGSEKQRIEQVFRKVQSKPFSAGLVGIHTDTELVSIRGFVGKPEIGSKNAPEYFFVNRRYMRHPYFHKAVQAAYQGLLPGDQQPVYFIYFTINPDQIDVNISPTKTEIKFADEQSIWQILLAAVRESLGKFDAAPTLDFDPASQIVDVPQLPSDGISRPEIQFDPSYNPFRQSRPSVPSNWQNLYPTDEHQVANDVPQHRPNESMPLSLLDELSAEPDMPYRSGQPLLQVANRYILTPSADGLLVVDQHRAHVKVCYERIKQIEQTQQSASQQLLFPETFELTAEEMPHTAQLLPLLRQLGFELELMGKSTFAINAIPAILGTASPVQVLQQIWETAVQSPQNAQERFAQTIAMSMADSIAIPNGRSLSETEMRSLMDDLFALPDPMYTADNRQIIAQMDAATLSHIF